MPLAEGDKGPGLMALLQVILTGNMALTPPQPGKQPALLAVPLTASHTGLFFREQWSVNHRPQTRFAG